MAEANSRVTRLGIASVPAVVDVLSESFFEYPVMRFVLGDSSPDYARRLQKLINFFVMARVLRKEFLIGIGEPEDPAGAALVSRPVARENPPELARLREGLWGELGASARARYEAFGAVCARFQVERPHLHLNMIGIRPRDRGKGLGRKLLQYVHELSEDDLCSAGVTLTTEDLKNVALYEHMGYKSVGHASVAPGLETWTFFRPDRRGSAEDVSV